MIINSVEGTKDDSIRIGMGDNKHLLSPFHYHLTHYELTYIEGGFGLLLIGDKILEFSGHEIVLIPPRIPHTWLAFKNHMPLSDFQIRSITLQFSLQFFTEGLLLRKEMNNIRRLLVAAERIVIIKNISDDLIINELLDLKLESDFNTYIHILEIFNRLGSIIEISQLLDSEYIYRGNKKDKSKFELVFSFILNNYTKRIKISEPAKILGLNDTAFSHYFKRRAGKSFTDFINELRLLEADAMIRKSNIRIARICYECGFNNLSNFNRIYKNWKGLTPAERRHTNVKT